MVHSQAKSYKILRVYFPIELEIVLSNIFTQLMKAMIQIYFVLKQYRRDLFFLKNLTVF